jgi:adenosine deaminase
MMLDRRQFIGATLALGALGSAPARAAATTTDAAMRRFITALPKAELHLHLEGTLEPDMKFALAARNGITLPYADVAAMRAGYRTIHDLTSFLKVYYEGFAVLLTEQDFYDLTYAYLKHAAAQTVLYTEMFFDPQQHLSRGVPMAAVVGGITRARADAARDLGIASQLILCFLRELSVESAMATLDAAAPFKRDIVGIGLDSEERGNPPAKFAAVYARARREGYRLTAHCDVNQIDTLGHIREAIDLLGVERIDHGGNIVESPELVALAKARNLFFTVCPTFSGVAGDGASRTNVVRAMLDRGLQVTISSDDPAYMDDNYIAESMLIAQHDSALTRADLITISRNSFNAAWIAPDQRDAYLAQLDRFAQNWAAA